MKRLLDFKHLLLLMMVAVVATAVACGGDDEPVANENANGSSSTPVSGNDGLAGNQVSAAPTQLRSAPEPSGEIPDVVKIGLIPSEDTDEVLKRYEPIQPWLEEQLGTKVEFFIGTDYAATVEALKAERLDAAFLNSFGYILAVDQGAAEIVVARAFEPDHELAGQPRHYHSTIVTRADRDDINSVDDLKGKQFGFVDPASTSGHLVPESSIRNLGIDPWKEMTALYSGGHDVGVMSVFNGTLDAAAVFTGYDENNPLVGGMVERLDERDLIDAEEMKVIWVSDEIPSGPIVVQPNAPQALKDKIRETFLNVRNSQEAIDIFEAVYTVGDDDQWDELRTAAELLSLDLQKLVTKDPRPVPDTVKIGLIPSEDTDEVLKRYKPIKPWLEEQLGAKVEFFIGTDYSATIEAMKAERLDAAFLNSFGYILAVDQGAAELVVARAFPPGHELEGQPRHYHSTIVTRADRDDINELNDLTGKDFGFVDPASTSGHLVPESGVRVAGIDPWEEWNALYSGGHDVGVMSVFNGTLDAAAVYTGYDEGNPLVGGMVERLDDRDLIDKEEIKVIWVSDPIPSGPIVVHPDAPQKLKDKLTNVFLSVADNPEAIEIFDATYTYGTDTMWDPLRTAAELLDLDLQSVVGG